MCQEASFVLTKPKVYWSRFTDSHEEIIKEFGLHADGVANGVNGPSILRVEVLTAYENPTKSKEIG